MPKRGGWSNSWRWNSSPKDEQAAQKAAELILKKVAQSISPFQGKVYLGNQGGPCPRTKEKWQCDRPECKFATNFMTRELCFKCGIGRCPKPRGHGAARSEATPPSQPTHRPNKESKETAASQEEREPVELLELQLAELQQAYGQFKHFDGPLKVAHEKEIEKKKAELRQAKPLTTQVQSLSDRIARLESTLVKDREEMADLEVAYRKTKEKVETAEQALLLAKREMEELQKKFSPTPVDKPPVEDPGKQQICQLLQQGGSAEEVLAKIRLAAQGWQPQVPPPSVEVTQQKSGKRPARSQEEEETAAKVGKTGDGSSMDL
jgi:DNA repair exonuclease SbcCD ATPase subunit